MHLTCTDNDAGSYGEFKTYVRPGDDVNDIFRLEGDMLFVRAGLVDYETMAKSNFSYVLTILAVDNATSGHVNTGSTVVIIQVY